MVLLLVQIQQGVLNEKNKINETKDRFFSETMLK